MRQPVNADDTMICPNCKDDGKGEIEIHAEPHPRDVGKFQWKNPDGSAHIGRPDTNFAHVIPESNFQVAQKTSQKLSRGILNPLEQEILAHKESLEKTNSAKNFAAYYHAVRRIFEASVVDLDPRVQGMVVGNMLSAFLTSDKCDRLCDVIPSETDAVTAKLKQASSKFSNSAKGNAYSALEGIGHEKQKVRQNVRQLLSDYPFFSTNKTTGNEKIALYTKVFGEGVAKESITRAFRHELNQEVKHYDEAENYVEWYRNGVKIE